MSASCRLCKQSSAVATGIHFVFFLEKEKYFIKRMKKVPAVDNGIHFGM
jgi:hypothetical protein